MVFLRVALALLLAVVSAGEIAGGQGATALPSGLQELWQGGGRCGEPTAEQWALTLEMDYRDVAEVASEAKVIPYRFIVEDLVAAAQAQAGNQTRRPLPSSGGAPVRRSASIGSSANIFGFTGHQVDTATGLIYMKGRYYDPEIGRFLTQDPVKGSVFEPLSLNPYIYAYANPTVYVDPDGRCVGTLQQTDLCQAIARTLEFVMAGDPIARAEREIERRENVVRGRREFRAQTGREPAPGEVVWSEGSRALTSGFEEIDMSGRVEPDHAEWVVAGAGISTRMAVGAARAAGASTAEQFIVGATQLGDEAVGELVGVSPGDVADLARIARRPWRAPAPGAPGSSRPMVVTEAAGGGVDLSPFPTSHGGTAGSDLGRSAGRHSAPTPGAHLAEQPRDALGQFLSKTHPRQRAPGVSAVDDFVERAQENGFELVGREVSVQTPFGQRRYDVVLMNPETGAVHAIEIKSSREAFDRFDQAARQQFAADRWVNQSGAQAVGNFEGVEIQDATKVLWEQQ